MVWSPKTKAKWNLLNNFIWRKSTFNVQLGIDIGRPLRTEIVHVQNRYYAKISWKGSRMFSLQYYSSLNCEHFGSKISSTSKLLLFFSTFILMPISYLGFNLFNDSLISIFWISLTPKNNRPIAIFCMTGLQKKLIR